MRLYERWLKVAAAAGDQKALTDVASGRVWTFSELCQQAEDAPRARERVLFARGFSVDLVFETLRAWRDGRVLCPVDGDSRPGVELFEGLPEEICHVKITSGSTAGPRLVIFRPEQLEADVDKIVATMGLRPEWTNLGAISLAHSYGFSNLVLPLLLHAIPLIWLGDPIPEVARTALAGYDAFTVPAVPALWRLWHKAEVIKPCLKLAISAGAPLGVDLEREIFETSGVKIHNFYGSSECGGIAYDASEEPRENPELAGRAMKNTFLSVNEATGCLEVRGPSVAEGYWPPASPEEPEEAGGGAQAQLSGGVFRTTDLARVRVENGDANRPAVYLSGRSDDVIIVAGKKVSPARVESVILRHPSVRHCVVFGIHSPDRERVQEVVACVSGNEVELDRLRRETGEDLAGFERPRHWYICQDLEPDARGKISRRVWRERFLETRR